MKIFNNAFELFQFLLELDKDNLYNNLLSQFGREHEFFQETSCLITAHLANQEGTSFNQLIHKTSSQLTRDEHILHLAGEQLGVYQLIEVIGQGGMGVVYLAKRSDGKLEQQVAVKILKPSISDIVGVELIQKEAQYLADLKHANIASVITVGQTQTKLSYMVMEYVEGISIIKYCEQNSLNLGARLVLFQKVLSAVKEAHNNLIIHADIKPSNILVTKQGEPKLMDFGISLPLEKSVTNKGDEGKFKSAYLKALSRDFSSPEQLNGERLTVLSDIYSLGCLFFCLVPKTLISSNEYGVLQEKFLANIPEDRFSSLGVIEQQIHAMSQNYPLPIINNSLYKWKKSFRRSPLIFSSFAMLTFVIFGSLFVLFNQNKQLRIERSVSEQSIRFMEGVFDYSSPYENQNSSITVKEILDAAQGKLSLEKETSPKVFNRVSLSLAKSYAGLGIFESASLLLLGIDSDDKNIIIEKQYLMAQIENNKLNFQRAQEYIDEGKLAFTGEYLKAYKSLLLLEVGIKKRLGQYSKAKGLNKELENLAKSLNDYEMLARVYTKFAGIHYEESDYNGSTEYSEKALEIYENNALNDKPMLSTILFNYGSAFEELGDLEQAEKLYKRLIALDEEVFGLEHPNTAINYNLLSYFYHTKGDFPLALSFANKAIEIHKAHAPFGGYERVDSLFNKAHALKALSDPEGAIAALLEAEQLYLEFLPENHHKFINLYNGLGVLYRHTLSSDEGEKYLNLALDIALQSESGNKGTIASIYGNLANIEVERKNYEKAGQLYNKRLMIRAEIYGEVSRAVAQSNKDIARLKRYMGEPLAGLQVIDKALAMALKVYPEKHASLSGFYAQKSLMLKELKKYDEALLVQTNAIAIAEAGYGVEHFSTYGFKRILADLYNLKGDYEKAYTLASSAYQFQLKYVGDEHIETKRAKATLELALSHRE